MPPTATRCRSRSSRASKRSSPRPPGAKVEGSAGHSWASRSARAGRPHATIREIPQLEGFEAGAAADWSAMSDRSPCDELVAAVQALAFARDGAAITAGASAAARRLTRADGAAFILREDDSVYYADEDAIAPLWKGRRFPLAHCISGWVMLNRASAAIADVTTDARIAQERYRRTFVRSLAIVPVGSRTPVGALAVYWGGAHTATADERQVLETLAETASHALANAQLLRDLQRSMAREHEARSRAEQANALKDDFLATLAHELRTPMTVIHGWLWRLKQPDLPVPELRRGIETIERNVALQGQLVQDLRDASRALAGKLELSTQLVDLGALCRVIAEVAKGTADTKGVAIV